MLAGQGQQLPAVLPGGSSLLLTPGAQQQAPRRDMDDTDGHKEHKGQSVWLLQAAQRTSTLLEPAPCPPQPLGYPRPPNPCWPPSKQHTRVGAERRKSTG